MRKILITAAALTLGTSAFAWTPAKDASLQSDAGAKYAALSAGSVEKNVTVDKAAYSTADAKGAVQAEDTAGYAVAKQVDAGMGGPEETADMWPACRPGPGDDRCIQLYEPGVLPALAALKSSRSDVAMGGPFEPAGDEQKPASTDDMDHSAMGHDASSKPTATAEAPMTEAEIQANVAAKQAATAATPGGVGGPTEARTGYPACSATVTDSCIQLYERGVTGEGN